MPGARGCSTGAWLLRGKTTSLSFARCGVDGVAVGVCGGGSSVHADGGGGDGDDGGGSTMMKTIADTSKGSRERGVGGSLATALRDRRAYVIPIQPNRSLPVRPAPHHTPSRPAATTTTATTSSVVVIVKPSAARSPGSSLVVPAIHSRPLVVDAADDVERFKVNQPNDVEGFKVTRPNDQANDNVDVATISKVRLKKREETLDEAKNSKKDLPKAEEEEKKKKKKEQQDDEKEEEKSAIMRRTQQRSVTTTHRRESFIDISHSPERIELLSDEISICPSRLDAASPGCWVHGSIVPRNRNRKRRCREKRGFAEGKSCEVMNNASGKTVPPLRLKKIQSLQEPRIARGCSTWQGIGRQTSPGDECRDGGFVRGEFAGIHFNGGGSNKYRIVTGHTPPYDLDDDDDELQHEQQKQQQQQQHRQQQRRIDSRVDSLDAAKLRYRQTKLKVKLRELRRKTVKLGKEMLRTVLTSSAGPRDSRMRQTMSCYEGQIRHLERLLNDLPKVAYDEDDVVVQRSEWDGYRDDHDHRGGGADDHEQSVARSPARTICSSASSSLSSSPSLEPPKLSPRSPTDYEAARSPSEVRNSPPVLPRVYVTIADCIGDAWDERCTRRARNKRRNRSPLAKAAESIAGPSSPVISTTTATAADDDDEEGTIISKDKVELLMEAEETYEEKNFLEIGKTDLEILEVYEEETSEHCNDEKKLLQESHHQEDVKPSIKRLASPEPVVIDATSVDTDYETKLQIQRKINVASGRRSLEELGENRADRERDTKEETVIVHEDEQVVESRNPSRAAGNGIGIAEQFPTLGNWIAKLSKKQNAESGCNKSTDNPRIEERPSAFQVFSPETAKPASPEVPRATAARPVIEEPVSVAPQWRAERWQEPQDQQPQSLPQALASALPMPPPPAPPPPPPPQPSLGQEFCSPIAMARLYTRNYAIDPYSVAYGYNPAIAAAAATASLWNSAAILQYPLMRPSSSLLGAQQPPRLPPGGLQYPGAAAQQSLQRPCHRFSVMQPSDGGKRPAENLLSYTRDGKILPSGYATTFEQTKRATVDYHRSVTQSAQSRGMSCTSGPTVDYRNCAQQQQQPQQPPCQEQQQQQQQQQFARSGYADGSMRLPVPGGGGGGGAWRTGHVLSAMGAADYNYGAAFPSWTSAAPGNIFKAVGTLDRGSTSGFVTAAAAAATLARPRNSKDAGDARNRETPHLGKVNYSPNSASNLECSNCGVAGSMFKCLGCEVAFYCDENCQTRHWSRHVISCPKKMPKLKKLVH